jgi:glycosyltransferase involved in cell wall biosynthesis
VFTIKSASNEDPLVSVIIPVYNSEPYLSEALNSVLKQRFSSFEVVCVDDNSKDNSLKILRKYAREYPSKVRVFKNDRNMGVGYSANLAISKAKGVFVARLDSDDVMIESRLKRQAEYLLSNPEVVIVGGQVIISDKEGTVVGKKKFPLTDEKIYNLMFNVMPIQQGASMINRAHLPKDFKFYKGNSRVAEEVELFFRLHQYGKFANLRANVLRYRQYRGSTSLKNPKKTFYDSFRVRLKAVNKYRYKPTFKGWFTMFIQFCLVSILPKNWVYPMFALLRGITTKRRRIKLSDLHILLSTKIEIPFMSDS